MSDSHASSGDNNIQAFKRRWSQLAATKLYDDLRCRFPSFTVDELVEVALMTSGNARAMVLFQAKVDAYDKRLLSLEKDLRELKEVDEEKTRQLAEAKTSDEVKTGQLAEAKKEIEVLEREVQEARKVAENSRNLLER
jgi:hypothetical protein